jgi:cytochrome P450 family 3 subfamily A
MEESLGLFYQKIINFHRNYCIDRFHRTFNGYKPALTVGDPELIKQILVKNFHNFRNRRENPTNIKSFSKNMFFARDDDWKRIRAIASPTFTSGKMKKMYSLIRECCDEFILNLDEYAKDGKEIDLKRLHGAYTMDVIAKCAFATNTNTHKDPNNPFTKNAFALFNLQLWKILLISLVPSFIIKIQAINQVITAANNIEFFNDFAKHLIRKRRENSEKHFDFLQLLMDAERNDNETREENDSNEAHHLNEGKDELAADSEALKNVIEKKLDESEILAQCSLFFIAGYETTATTLSFCSYELALHPDIQERLYEEIKSVFDENGEIPYEILSKLPFLDSIISETLRLHPPVMKLIREAMEDIDLDNFNVKIQKGVIAEIPVYAIHHDPEFYENPLLFNPDRFMPENRSKITPYTYLPFGAGPRNCIGMRFALLEAKLALAKITRKFRFFRTPKTDVPLEYSIGRRLLQAKSLIVGIERR